VFCHSLTIDDEGYITGHRLRLRDQKRKAVESFQRLNYRIISIGDSFNDISMMKAAERGIFMHPSEKAVQAHPEFPVCTDYDQLKSEILKIVGQVPAILPRSLATPIPLDFEMKYRSMYLVLANVAGTFAPEPWPALCSMTGVEELGTTTSHAPDYDSLMQYRMKAMKDNNIKLQKMFDVVERIEPLPGAKDFLEWLKPIVPRSFMITDTFEEYAKPVFDKLGHPMVFCNFVGADEDGFLNKHIVRLTDQKKLACEEFQRLNFKIIAIGYSFNDIPMMKAAEHGIFFNPSDHLMKAHPEFQTVKNYDELKTTIKEILKQGALKRKREEL